MISYALIVSFGVWGMPQLLVRFYSIKSVDVLRIGTVVTSLGGSMALLPYLDGAIARVLHPGLTSAVVGLFSLGIALRPPALVRVLTAFAWAVIASTCLWPILFGIYWKGATRWGVLSSMASGLAVSLIWMALGSPFGLHGFIPGTAIGLIVLLLVSRFTRKLSVEHLAWVWGENRPSSTKGWVSPSLR